MFRFEKLDVWHRAIDFADLVYGFSRKFLDYERYGLMSQMRRAAVSVSSNVAEGSGRVSDKEFARFLEMSYASVLEVVSQGEVAHRQQILSAIDRDNLKRKAEELTRMLSGLRNTLLKKR
jgi:four helix bundle protein